MSFPHAPLENILRSAAETRAQLLDSEASWKQLRAESRALAMALIFDHGYSIAKTSLVTGHHRNSLKLWADIETARRSSPEDA